MATITEDYVSFEIAKLLKEKGFSEPCHACYAYFSDDDIRVFDLKYSKATQSLNENRYPYVSIYVAMKWLREVHNLCIEPYRTSCGYLYTISTIPYGSCKCNPREGGDDEDSGQWTTYEGAVEAALKYTIENLI